MLKLNPSFRYPKSGSRTCCHGLIEAGLLIMVFLFLLHALIISGINLSFDQSPPPITLPARAVQNNNFLLSFKKSDNKHLK